MVSLSKKSVEDFLNYCNFFGNCKSNSFLVCLTWFPIPGTMEQGTSKTILPSYRNARINLTVCYMKRYITEILTQHSILNQTQPDQNCLFD